MQCVVTAGPTYEPLDEVRRLTNFSTGQLGTELAAFLTTCGHKINLLIGEHATYRGVRLAETVETFTTTADLKARLGALAASAGIEAVFHAAAVSDYAFGKILQRGPDGELKEVHGGKISTRDGNLLAELVPTSKIISQLRGLFPEALLVGWKFEVEGHRAGVIQAARRQLAETRTDACVANGPAYGDGFGLVQNKGDVVHVENKPELFNALLGLLRATTASK